MTFWSRLLRLFVIALVSGIIVLVGCRSNPNPSNTTGKGALPSASNKTKIETSLPHDSITADLGFRPVTDGFSFSNYGKDSNAKGLSAVEMQRMFGNGVCVDQAEPCILNPPAKKWMAEVNKSMGGGHCEGMAALSLILYADKEKSKEFSSVPNLTLKDNEKLQREIAYWFATQYVRPTSSSEMKGEQVPSQILDQLLATLKPNAPITETYTMGIYQPGFRGGHAITPYGVADLGSGKYAIALYDNNHPQVERVLELDRNTNTWKYNASTNPDEPEADYIGNAETRTLTLTPTPPRYQRQECDFCGTESESGSESDSETGNETRNETESDGENKAATNGNTTSAPQPRFNQIFLEGDADLLITNGDQKIGYENDKFVNSFPGAIFTPIKSSELWEDDEEPLYEIPVNVPFTINLQGTKKSNTKEPIDVAMIGYSYDVGLSNIKISPNQKDVIQFDKTGHSLIYKPSNPESPDVFFGISTTKDDYEFELNGIEIDAGGTITANLDKTKGRLSLKITDTQSKATFDLEITRIGDAKEQTFEGTNVALASGDTLYFNYAKWSGNGGKLTVEIDQGSNGSLEQVTTIEDQQK